MNTSSIKMKLPKNLYGKWLFKEMRIWLAVKKI